MKEDESEKTTMQLSEKMRERPRQRPRRRFTYKGAPNVLEGCAPNLLALAVILVLVVARITRGM